MRGAAQGRVSSITRVVTCQGVPERVDFMTSGFFLPSLHVDAGIRSIKAHEKQVLDGERPLQLMSVEEAESGVSGALTHPFSYFNTHG